MSLAASGDRGVAREGTQLLARAAGPRFADVRSRPRCRGRRRTHDAHGQGH